MSNGRHFCPGCGAQLHMTEDEKSPGWIDRIRLRERLKWMADAPIGLPQIFVTKNRTSVIPNKFVRQSDWFNRLYTRAEIERIQKRSEIPEGMANTVLQQYRSTKDKVQSPKVAVPKRSDIQPLMEELADEQVLVDSSKFEELAEQLGAVSRKDLVDSNNPCLPLICQRCHDLKSNENILTLSASSTEGPQLFLSERDKRIVRDEMNSRSLIVLVTDLSNLPFSIPSSAVDLLKEHLKFGEEFPSILVIGNKLDLLPKHLKNAESYLLQLVRDKIGPEAGGKILGAHLISAKEGTGISELRRHLLQVSSERDGNIFLVGRTNAGKSLVFNSIIGRKDTNRATATVSAKAGTTIGAIKNRLCSLSWADESLKINPLRVIVDLPGIVDGTESLLSVLTPEEAKKAIVSNRIHQLRRKLAPDETALFGGLIRIACEGKDPKINVMLKLYMRPDWYYFRTPTPKVEEFVKSHLGQHRSQPPHLMPPILPDGVEDARWNLFANPEVACQIDVTGESAQEIAFSDGIGWISAHLANPSDRVTLTVRTPKGLGVTIRPSMVDTNRR